MSKRQRMAWAVGVLAGGMALASAARCKRSDPAPTAQPAPAPEATAASSAGMVALSPTTTTSAEAPSAQAESPAPVNTAAADAVPRFFLVAETAVEHVIVGKSGALLVRFTEETYKGISTSLEIVDDRIFKAPEALDGIEWLFGTMKSSQLKSLGGSWPDAAFAVTTVPGYRGTSLIWLFRWNGLKWDKWLDLDAMYSGWTAAVAARKGTLIAAYATHSPAGHSEVTIHTAAGEAFKPLPVKGVEACGTRLGHITDLAVAPSGDLFAFGEDCLKDNADVVERFNREGTSTGVFALPELADSTENQPVSFAALSASEVYMAGATKDGGKPAFVQLDGSTWKPVAGAPFQQAITSLDPGNDGSLWAVSDGAVFRRSSGGAWVKAEMPEGAKARRVQATAGDTWVFGSLGEQPAVFRTRPMKYPVKVDAAPQAEPATKPVPSTPACKTPFVLLYKVAENAAPNYDFPKTREAVAGHMELAGMSLVVTDQGYFGATVPTHEVGDKLVEVVKDKVKGARPQVVCMAPKIQEEIPIDLATGNVKRP